MTAGSLPLTQQLCFRRGVFKPALICSPWFPCSRTQSLASAQVQPSNCPSWLWNPFQLLSRREHRQSLAGHCSHARGRRVYGSLCDLSRVSKGALHIFKEQLLQQHRRAPSKRGDEVKCTASWEIREVHRVMHTHGLALDCRALAPNCLRSGLRCGAFEQDAAPGLGRASDNTVSPESQAWCSVSGKLERGKNNSRASFMSVQVCRLYLRILLTNA